MAKKTTLFSPIQVRTISLTVCCFKQRIVQLAAGVTGERLFCNWNGRLCGTIEEVRSDSPVIVLLIQRRTQTRVGKNDPEVEFQVITFIRTVRKNVQCVLSQNLVESHHQHQQLSHQRRVRAWHRRRRNKSGVAAATNPEQCRITTRLLKMSPGAEVGPLPRPWASHPNHPHAILPRWAKIPENFRRRCRWARRPRFRRHKWMQALVRPTTSWPLRTRTWTWTGKKGEGVSPPAVRGYWMKRQVN